MSESVYPWLAGFFFLGAFGTWCAGRYALSRRLLDQPGERRSHSAPTPRGGGISIVTGLLLAVGLLAWQAPGLELSAFGVGATLVAGVGWLDDHRPLSPWLRLGVHVIACVSFAAALAIQGAAGWEVAIGFALPLALTNIWNFMDGIDGIAASQAVIVLLGVLVFLPEPHAWLALALVASCLGFLPFNFPRARIFLGDVGSGTLGFALGGMLALCVTGGGAPAVAWLLLPLAPFLVDSGLTLLRRVARGERWWTPHVQHAYQVCARRFGHVPVTFGYALAALAGLGFAMLNIGSSPTFMSFSILAWYTSAAVLWLCLQGIERDGGRRGRSRQGDGKVQ